MSQPNAKGEWLNQKIKIIVMTEGGNELYRNYELIDGQVPQSAKEGLQDMVDTLLDTSEL